jgi:hypothetical protein
LSLGATAVADLILAKTDEVALILRSLTSHPDGMRFTLNVQIRQRVDAGTHVLPSIYHRYPPNPPDEGFICVGVRFADGTTVRNIGNSHGGGLWLGGGGGDDRSYRFQFDVFPLASPGPMEVWVAWPGAGLLETRMVLDGGAIRRTGLSTESLW